VTQVPPRPAPTDESSSVIWIGGPTGAGKTTVTRRLAQRWGLRIYSSDNWTWVHRDRAIAAGVEAAIQFEQLTPDLRAAASFEDRQAMWLVDQRAVMVVEDVRALPASPLVIAEGGVISPRLVDPARAVWLHPTEAFQLRHRPAAWVGIGYSSDDAKGYGIPAVSVDGYRAISDIVEEVERALMEPLRIGPLASSPGERRELLRSANLDEVRQVHDGCARPWATADPDTQLRSFVCESGHHQCASDVEVPVALAAASPVIADGHR
jgi:hypothetical protein